MIVPNDLEQERVEGSPPHLMSSLSSSPVSAGKLLLVSPLIFRVHPAGVVVHPRFVDLLHVVVAEDGVGGHFQQQRHAGGQQIVDERLHQMDEHGKAASIRAAARQH